jgi:surfeit locus 1 family protein
VLVLVMAFTCVQLGLWQLSRRDEKRDRIDLVRDAQERPAVPVESLLSPDDPRTGPGADAVAFRTVTATGTFDLDHEVLVRNRPLDGVNGNDVVTPLVLADGTAVLVTRGWVPFDVPADRPLPGAEPPTGEVTVTGVLQRTETRGGLAPQDAPDGDLGTVGHLDVGAVADALPYPVLPLTVLLAGQDPAQPGRYPAVVEPDEPGQGPHLSYAIQWFTFATLALVIWPLVIRKAARRGTPPPEPGGERTGEPEPAAASAR